MRTSWKATSKNGDIKTESKKVKQSRYRNGQALRLPEFVDSRHLKVAELSVLRTGQLYSPRRYPWYSFLLEFDSIPGPQCGRNELATFWLAAQRKPRYC